MDDVAHHARELSPNRVAAMVGRPDSIECVPGDKTDRNHDMNRSDHQKPAEHSNFDAASRPRRVALIGHCGPDSWMLKGAAARALPGATIAMINDTQGAMEQARSSDLLLINRVLDGDFDNDSGIDLIGLLAGAQGRTASLMLISNFPEAQQQAIAAGAVPGFGKANAGSAAAAKLMQAAAQSR